MTAGLDGMMGHSAVDHGSNPAVDESRARSRRRLALPFLLAVGWGALIGYGTVLLTQEAPLRLDPGVARVDPEPGPFEMPHELERPVRSSWSDVAAAPVRSENPAAPQDTARVQTATLVRPPEPAAPISPAVISPPIERAAYVGIWGPTEAACGQRSQRRGFLPATITTDSARAGRTVCQFRDSRRAGNGWTMAASCSDRGRRWSSRVRLVVDGDHLIWSSAQGASSYVRCRRRDG